jgi:hypothetical protein
MDAEAAGGVHPVGMYLVGRVCVTVFEQHVAALRATVVDRQRASATGRRTGGVLDDVGSNPLAVALP